MPRPGDSDDKDRDLDGPLGARIELALERLLNDAEQLLRDNYYEVLSVAHALETHKTLAGEDVEAVIDCTVGPLIDGRIYASQEMKDELQAYHEPRRRPTASTVRSTPCPAGRPARSRRRHPGGGRSNNEAPTPINRIDGAEPGTSDPSTGTDPATGSTRSTSAPDVNDESNG